MVFHLFWTSTRKRCIFTGKILAGLPKLLSSCAEEHLQSNISERKSWKFEHFRIIFDVFGTMAEIFFQGWQNTNRCPRELFMKTFFQKRDIRYFFPILSDFFTSSKNFRKICKTRNLGIRGSFWGKTYLNFICSSTLLWSLIEKTLGR